MSLKNLLVHLDDGPRCAARLELAVALAQRHDARLVGLFGRRAQAEQVGFVATWPPEEYAAAAAASRAAFAQATAGLAAASWQDVNRGSDAELLRAITNVARYFDLVVFGQHEDQDDRLPQQLLEEVVVNAGRPMLVLPYADRPQAHFHRPLIAWNDSREAAHAVNDALPLIAGCQEAVVLSLDEHRERAAASCAAVAAHLACHGIAAKSEVLVVEDVGVMDMLLNRVADHGADLLVMGAHGQIAFPFLAVGSGTRHVLEHMTVPTLMSN